MIHTYEERIAMRRNWIAFARTVPAFLAGAVHAQPGYGQGMMGGYGPGYYGGPGMMGGYGPGMMGGYGPGMMGGWGSGPRSWGLSDLTADQRSKIQQVQQEFWNKQWPLMQQMHSAELASDGSELDDQAARKQYETVSALHKQMFENRLEMRKKIEAILTPKQREQLRQNWGR
jgi:Spy/CpxP family protein refolding chaperone